MPATLLLATALMMPSRVATLKGKLITTRCHSPRITASRPLLGTKCGGLQTIFNPCIGGVKALSLLSPCLASKDRLAVNAAEPPNRLVKRPIMTGKVAARVIEGTQSGDE